MKAIWKRFLYITLSCMFVVSILASYLPLQAKILTKASGQTYYVSSTSGNDANNGLSKEHPFKRLEKINNIVLQPGDTVLLEKGSVFEDQYLHIKGSGSAAAPIKISSYGKAAKKPAIHANGKGAWEQDYGKHLDNPQHKYKGTVSSAILLYDVEYIEINGLEITNSGSDGTKVYNDLDVMDRTGVAGFAKDKGTLHHIVLNDLDIHDVIGNVYNKHMLNGGIYFATALATDDKVTGIPKYDDLVIQNCHLKNVNRWGIAAAYTAYYDHFKGTAISDADAIKYGSTNVVIDNNFIDGAGGDAITTMYCYKPLIQNNVANHSARQINTTDYSKTGFGRTAAGIWPWKCKDALFQYNECYNTLNADGKGNGDGQAYDADSGDGTVYQFNYSSGNTGGAVMFCLEESYRNTFRYNISQNDEKGVLNLPGQHDAHVYNNTFYIKEGVNLIRGDMNNGPTKIENNIIYYTGKTPKTENWNPSGNKTYDNNLYYNYANTPNDAHAIIVNADDAVMMDAGKAPNTSSDKLNLHMDPNIATVFDGYKLANNSIATNKGKLIHDANGFAIDKDFFGNKIGIPDIGAAASSKVSLALYSTMYTIKDKKISGIQRNTKVDYILKQLVYDPQVSISVKNKAGEIISSSSEVKTEMYVELTYQNEKVKYALSVGDNDTTIHDTIFMQKGNTLLVPSTLHNPMTVGNLLSGIQIAKTSTIAVFNQNTRVLKGNVNENMTVKVTAENGDETVYPITIKSIYQWALDYAGQHQGNVWFAQINNGENAYTNLTEYDPQYPNWVVDTWFGAGIDAKDHSFQPTEDTHGLLSDTIGASKKAGIAMSYRAPKSGVVSFSIKDDEPYLRQANNSDGSVILSLTVNGKVLQSCELTQSLVKGNFPDIPRIEVKKGEYIRVEASNKKTPTKPSVHVTPTIRYLNEANPMEDKEVPSKVKNIQIQNVTSNSAAIQWDASVDNVDVEKYKIYNGNTLLNTILNGLSAQISNLQAGKEYNLKVVAVDAKGNQSLASTCTFTTLPKDKEYQVKYAFVSGTNQEVLPQEVFALLPQNEIGKKQGTKVIPTDVKEKEISIKGGKWIFKGWDNPELVIADNDAVFKGIWVYKKDIPIVKSDADIYKPIIRIQQIFQGDTPDPTKSIENLSDMPEKTTYQWATSIDTKEAGMKQANLMIMYPDKSSVSLKAMIDVKARNIDINNNSTDNKHNSKKENENSPVTGDKTNAYILWILFGGAGIVVLGSLFLSLKKKRENTNKNRVNSDPL